MANRERFCICLNKRDTPSKEEFEIIRKTLLEDAAFINRLIQNVNGNNYHSQTIGIDMQENEFLHDTHVATKLVYPDCSQINNEIREFILYKLNV